SGCGIIHRLREVVRDFSVKEPIMSGRSLGFVFLSVLLFTRMSSADEPAAESTVNTDSDETKVAAAIERTLDVIDLILEHHIDPPPRPEMLRLLAAQMYLESDESKMPRSVGEEAARCTGRDESRRFLARLRVDLHTVLTNLIETPPVPSSP